MTAADRSKHVTEVHQRYARLAPHLPERTRRLWAATEALTLGRGGVALVARATGLARATILKGRRELLGTDALPSGQRHPGAGRKPLAQVDPTLLRDLDRLIDPHTRGDPESPLRWTSKSTYQLAATLQSQGHAISQRTVHTLLVDLDYSLQANRKAVEGADHPDRDAQFQWIYQEVKRFQKAGQPVISIDAKKKELIGNYGQGGREWEKAYEPRRVRAHDFRDPKGTKACPVGVYDLLRNEGWVHVGISQDTAQFAVASIRGWWEKLGRTRYPRARRLLMTADAGGSNSYRTHLWKRCLQELADASGLVIQVCHFPPGTSKWNKIEQCLFSYLSKNWRGRPLDSLATVVNLIAHTTTETGLVIEASLDYHTYEKGIEVSDEELAALQIKPQKFHGEWNYCVLPRRGKSA